MEYLLLTDGTVVPFDSIKSHEEVKHLLKCPSSAGYYWQTLEFGWSCFTIVDHAPIIRHQITDLPEMVKFAAMLE